MFKKLIFIVICFSCFSNLQGASNLSEKKYDIIIVGGGAIGLAAAYYGAQTDKKILLLEQDSFFNDTSGSSSAARQFRVHYNDPRMTQLALDSIPLWNELQSRTNESIFVQSGCLWFGDVKTSTIEGSIQNSAESLRKLNLTFEMLNAQEIENRYHFSNLPSDWQGLMEPHGGMNNVKGTLRAFYQGAKERVDFLDHKKVTNIQSTEQGVIVNVGNEVYYGNKLILAPGAEINELLKPFNIQLDIDIWEMVLVYYKLKNKNVNTYPVWLGFQESIKNDPNRYYGFPAHAWEHPEYSQVGSNYPSRIYKSMSEYKHIPDPETIDNISRWVREHMKELEVEPNFPTTCVCALFTDPNNRMNLRHEMLLDFAPSSIPYHNNIVICATGWAFKLAPLLGKICIELATTGSTKHDISGLKFSEDMVTVREDP